MALLLLVCSPGGRVDGALCSDLGLGGLMWLGECSVVGMWGKSLSLFDAAASPVACALGQSAAGVVGESSGDFFVKST